MIVEERIYTLHPGKVPEYMKHYETEGLAVQIRHLPRMVGYFTTEIGPLNQVIHMWGYDGLDQRAERRAALGADPAWQAYVAKIRPLIITQESKILLPMPWSPIK